MSRFALQDAANGDINIHPLSRRSAGYVFDHRHAQEIRETTEALRLGIEPKGLLLLG